MTPTRPMSANEKVFFSRWQAAEIKPSSLVIVNEVAGRILNNKDQYQILAGEMLIPFWVIGLIHYRETSLDFTKHLYNGDPLTARTVHVPAGRPMNGEPPFTWEESANDALTLVGWNKKGNWDLVNTLARCEMYNGWSYFKKGVPSPYLWSDTTVYTSGKFAADGKYDPLEVDAQPGCAAIMKALATLGIDLQVVFPA